MSHLNNSDLKALFVSGTAATPAKFASLIDSSWNVIENDNVLLGPTSATANAFDYWIDGYTGTTGTWIPGYTAKTGLWGLVGPTGSANGLWYEVLNDVPAGLTGTTGTTGQIYADTNALYICLGSGNWLAIGAGLGSGATGATGPQGVQGASNGPQGTQGTIGYQGIQGLQGTLGTQGSTGPQGTAGSAGSTGATGNSAILTVVNQSVTGSPFTITTSYTLWNIYFLSGPTTTVLNLPANPARGTKIIIKDAAGDLGTNGGKFLVTPASGERIDLSTSPVTMEIPRMSLTFVWHDSSTSWFII